MLTMIRVVLLLIGGVRGGRGSPLLHAAKTTDSNHFNVWQHQSDWFTETVPPSGWLVLHEPAPNQLAAYPQGERHRLTEFTPPHFI